ncbi:GGDEF domain-containing protein [Arcobacter arenosus]|jgi:diguanylate cyclase (GGDEF)-like protein|uniref:diguanylate cyclase n=1 Tax=Arcobacter arenosus TaxID=2576037 RepID=A0A5R8Y544_9BACT|nr:GGDEF domain-containing protein [Arcobacter arenosus]TLP41205.1 GGDEF domain-containing protein [Arcobacter arenosus]
MNSKRKISLSLLLVMSVMFIILIINILINFREYGIQSVENKAKAIAQTVKHSLTSHMVNGVIDNRSLFLEQIENLENIDNIWLSRAPAVIEQFGKGNNNEVARDKIDEEVLNTGKEKAVVEEKIFGKSSYRITIPYIGNSEGSIDCLSCHTTAKEGDTLGAITISMSVDDLKEVGITTLTNTTIIALILIVFILIFVNKLISPFLTLFESINRVMKKAQIGDYSDRIGETNGKESDEVASWIDGLLEKLQSTLEDIEHKINVFLVHQKRKRIDPLVDVKTTVNRLADIYRFRKTIEHDENINEVYERLAYILREKFKITDFNFIEADTTHKNTNVIYIEKEIHCNAQDGCRADRTNTIVDSCQFHKMCDKFNYETKKSHICIPYSISNDLDFIVSIVNDTEEEHQRVRDLLPSVQDYIDTAKPEIVSKKLMYKLELTARTDPLTGLYNRKYLEESLKTIVSQAKRANITYGILMADIDFFKMINDTYGHDVGDEAIKIVSQTLIENTRESDIVIRFGGEEFIVLLHNCNEDFVFEIAEKIRVAFSKKEIPVASTSFNKTISIGASIFPTHTNNFWQCVKFADIALYNAKENGRNKSVVFSKELLKDKELTDEY